VTVVGSRTRPGAPHPIVRALAERRQALGMSQRALAKLAGTTQSAVSAIETGAVPNPNLSTLLRLAAVLGCEVDMRLRPAGTPASTDRREEAVQAAVHHLRSSHGHAEGVSDA
jgi:transcriptional regulator with XRE-family HTH domain